MSLSGNSLSAITAKAKDQWKKNKKNHQKPAKKNDKKSVKKSKKRSIKQMDVNNEKSPSKKRKITSKKKKSLKIDYNLPLNQQKKRSVIKLQNMPTGLEERQMIVFFKQFGTVTRCCLKRHRYGRSLRYGYIEFAHPQIAKIVENTLDCTSMYGQMIVCKEIPPEKVNGAQFFNRTTIEKARLHKKCDNDKVRWLNASTISNLEFQFDEWYKTLIEDEMMIKRHLKKEGIVYEFDGFGKEIQRIKEKNMALTTEPRKELFLKVDGEDDVDENLSPAEMKEIKEEDKELTIEPRKELFLRNTEREKGDDKDGDEAAENMDSFMNEETNEKE